MANDPIIACASDVERLCRAHTLGFCDQELAANVLRGFMDATERRIEDLINTNNQYLERARKAEAALKGAESLARSAVIVAGEIAKRLVP